MRLPRQIKADPGLTSIPIRCRQLVRHEQRRGESASRRLRRLRDQAAQSGSAAPHRSRLPGKEGIAARCARIIAILPRGTLSASGTERPSQDVRAIIEGISEVKYSPRVCRMLTPKPTSGPVIHSGAQPPSGDPTLSRAEMPRLLRRI
jgi:hypothetical protein